jgi:hypothetical protein
MSVPSLYDFMSSVNKRTKTTSSRWAQEGEEEAVLKDALKNKANRTASLAAIKNSHRVFDSFSTEQIGRARSRLLSKQGHLSKQS